MKYVLQYRSRALRGTRSTQEASWKDAQTFNTLEAATQVRDDAIKYEAKGTKDWRVRSVQP
jgi:hypothetical protein